MTIEELINRNYIFQVFFEKILNFLNIYKTSDQTFGRKGLPRCKEEEDLIDTGLLKAEQYLHLESIYYPYHKSIFYQHWSPNATIKGDIIRVHGMGDHTARFISRISEYTNKGFAVHLLDLPGHGRSDGVHGHVEDFEEFIEAIDLVIDEVKRYNEGRKIFLYGSSMGGLLALVYATKFGDKIDGLNLFCPALKIEDAHYPPKIVLSIGKILRTIIPRLGVIARKTELFNDDPESEIEYLKDQMSYSGPTRIGLGFSVLDAAKYLEDNIALLKKPFLIQQGSADRVVNPQACMKFKNLAVNVVDKKVILYPECEHAMLEFKNYHIILEESINWLTSHV